MPFPIKPGKVTCAGLVGILMVLPNSVWKGPDAKVQAVIQKPAKSVPSKPQKDPRIRY